jgi:hypothetical protein
MSVRPATHVLAIAALCGGVVVASAHVAETGQGVGSARAPEPIRLTV